jgi:glycosyltransferase involved in cell wall biosynthesis
MKVAILHYWFLLNGGGEKVVSALLKIYPQADVFCLFADKRAKPIMLPADRLHCSALERIPFGHHMNRALLPFYSPAVGNFDFSGYDLVISSDSPPIKDIVTPVETTHISYCHTPGRFIWDLAPSFNAKLPWIARPFFAAIAASARASDFAAAQRVSHFVANSKYIAKRIMKYYRRDSTVIYPPVDTARGYISSSHGDYYLSVGRLTATKRIDLLIAACNRLGRRLVIAGTGREEKRLKAMAGDTIEFLGRVPDEALPELYARCRAFLFAADEDFGIVAVEAQSFGRPVVAYGHGGSLESVRVNDVSGRSDTGVFFSEQTADSVIGGIRRFEALEETFAPCEIREFAGRFAASTFEKRFRDFADAVMEREVAC